MPVFLYVIEITYIKLTHLFLFFMLIFWFCLVFFFIKLFKIELIAFKIFLYAVFIFHFLPIKRWSFGIRIINILLSAYRPVAWNTLTSFKYQCLQTRNVNVICFIIYQAKWGTQMYNWRQHFLTLRAMLDWLLCLWKLWPCPTQQAFCLEVAEVFISLKMKTESKALKSI